MIKLQETATQIILRGPDHQIRDLVDAFRFHPPGYYYATSYQQWMKSDGTEGWDGFIYPLTRVQDGVGMLPRGRKKDLLHEAYELGIKCDTDGLLENPFAGLELDDVRPDLIVNDYVLDERQRTCILNWLRAAVGINKVTVGGGKTATFAGAAALIKERYPDARFLYITPSERLARQSTKEMRKMLPHLEVGQCGGGHHDFEAKDMVVCTVSMLNRHFEGLYHENWFDTFLAIFYDEVHHAASPTSKKIMNVIPAFFRFGASDTSKEKDVAKYYAIRGLFGPRLTEVKSAPLIKEGRLAKPHIYIVDHREWKDRFCGIEHKPEAGSPAFVLLDGAWVKGKYLGPVYEVDEEGNLKTKPFKTADIEEYIDKLSGQKMERFRVEERPILVNGLHRIEIDKTEYEIESRWCLLERLYDRAIIQFKSRNDTIVRWADYFHRQGWSTVVVATRTTHVYILESLLRRVIPKKMVRIMTGYENDSPQERDAMFEWFKKTPGAVLVTPLVKEGVSINEIQAMVVADYVTDHEVAKQIIGRAMRVKKDNRAHVVWFWDRQHAKLSKGCRNLLEFLEQTAGFSYYHPVKEPEDVFDKPPRS